MGPLLAALIAQAAPGAVEAHVVRLDPLGDGAGAAETVYEMPCDGKLYVSVACGDVAVSVRVVDPEGEVLGEAGGVPGEPSPCLVLDVAPGRVLRIAVSAGKEGGACELRLAPAPESPSTWEAAERGRERVAELSRRSRAQGFEAVRPGFAELIEELGTVAGAESSTEISTVLELVGHAVMQAGGRELALRAYERVLDFRERHLPPDHPAIQSLRNNVGNLFSEHGDPWRAREVQEALLEVRLRTLPEDDPRVRGARANLAITYDLLGEQDLAREMQEEILRTSERTLPEDHVELQMARGNLGTVLRKAGDLSRARELQEQALAVLSRTLPEEDALLQWARSNLADTLTALGELELALDLQETALAARERILPPAHPQILQNRVNLAMLRKDMGEWEGARDELRRVLDARARTLDATHPHVQTARLNLAAVLLELGETGEARELAERVLAVHAETLPQDHPHRATARLHLAVALAVAAASGVDSPGSPGGSREGDRELYERLALEAGRSLVRSLGRTALTASAREVEEQALRTRDVLGPALSLLGGMGVFEPTPAMVEQAWRVGESTRGLGLVCAAAQRAAREVEGYAGMRERLRAASERLGALAQAGSDAAAFAAARTEREEAERELLAMSAELSAGGRLRVDLEPGTLAAGLGPADAVVGFRSYPRGVLTPEGTRRTATVESLVAFVLRADGSIVREELGPMEPVREAIGGWLAALRGGAGSGDGRGVSVAPERGGRAGGGRVRELVIDPLEAALEGTERWILALDDVLHEVPFDALPLPGEKGNLLGESVRIELRPRLGGGAADLAAPAGGSRVVLLGDVDFDAVEDAGGDESAAQGLPDGTAGTSYAPLPATGTEVRAIAALARETLGARGGGLPEDPVKGIAVDLLLEREASRSALFAGASSARILHLATHGWFSPGLVGSGPAPAPLDERAGIGRPLALHEAVRRTSPMLLAGLALAGANLPPDGTGRTRGVVTAEDLSTLDLFRCELVVLSACDTSLGVNRPGQGIASLQRALHVAGARTVVTSLWQVPDESTRELMVAFYRLLWVERMPADRALWEAKMQLRAARDEHGRPRYRERDWAGWVLTQAAD